MHGTYTRKFRVVVFVVVYLGGGGARHAYVIVIIFQTLAFPLKCIPIKKIFLIEMVCGSCLGSEIFGLLKYIDFILLCAYNDLVIKNSSTHLNTVPWKH